MPETPEREVQRNAVPETNQQHGRHMSAEDNQVGALSQARPQ
jgi:hypothetical protein